MQCEDELPQVGSELGASAGERESHHMSRVGVLGQPCLFAALRLVGSSQKLSVPAASFQQASGTEIMDNIVDSKGCCQYLLPAVLGFPAPGRPTPVVLGAPDHTMQWKSSAFSSDQLWHLFLPNHIQPPGSH